MLHRDDHRNEEARLQALRALEVLDTPPEAEFDAIVAGAQHVFDSKFAYVSLVDTTRQWFKARCGPLPAETPRNISFCNHAIAAEDMLVIADAAHDPRFAGSPLVAGPPFIRFYAGVPLRVRGPGGGAKQVIGTLCVADDAPHDPDPVKLDQLRGMAHIVEALLEARRANRESLQLALDRQNALLESERTQRLLAHAERMAGIGSWRVDLATGNVHWSDQTYVLHGLEPGADKGMTEALAYYPEAHRSKLAVALERCRQEGVPWDMEADFVDACGRSRRVRTVGELEVQGGKPVAIVGVVQDISNRYAYERRLQEVARTDELTGIASRRAFNERLDAAVEQAEQDGEPLAVAIIDLDRFKEVNDRLGHAEGDEVLRLMAGRLRSAGYLGSHFCARLGGDEFALLLRGAHATQLDDGMERLLADLRCEVPADGGSIMVSATIGACVYRHGLRRSALLKQADEALYRAKRAERGTGAIAGEHGVIRPCSPMGYDPVEQELCTRSPRKRRMGSA